MNFILLSIAIHCVSLVVGHTEELSSKLVDRLFANSTALQQRSFRTQAANWVVVSQYPTSSSSSSCSGSPYSFTAALTGLCTYDGISAYYIRTCTEDTITTTAYSDYNCQYSSGVTTMPTGCADPLYYSCVSSSTFPYPVSGYQYVATVSYTSFTCDTTTAFAVTGVPNNYCMNGFDSKGVSSKYNWPAIVEYTGTDCTGDSSTYTTVTYCHVLGGAGTKLQLVGTLSAGTPTASPSAASATPRPSPTVPTTNRPTVGPSLSPTCTPTAAPTRSFAFTVTQIIDGLSVTEYNSAKTANDEAVKSAAASCMSGVSKDLIDVSSVAAATTASLTAHRRMLMGVQAASDAVNVTYIVNYGVLSGQDGEASYNTYSAALSNAVSSGAFTTALHAAATSAGAVHLTSASSSSVHTSGYTTTSSVGGSSAGSHSNSSSSGGHQSGSSVGMIVGIVVGVVAFVVIVGGLINVCSSGGGSALGKATSVVTPA